MVNALFGPEGAHGGEAASAPTADHDDGALGLVMGLAANRCLEAGQLVCAADVLPGVLSR
jgi:hypothetical protein